MSSKWLATALSIGLKKEVGMYRLSFNIDKYNVSLLDVTLANNFH